MPESWTVKGGRPEKEMPDSTHLGGFQLLPPAPGVCQECARDHDPRLPHDQQSMFWQYSFYGKHGRWPSWEDAMAHCEPEIWLSWLVALLRQDPEQRITPRQETHT